MPTVQYWNNQRVRNRIFILKRNRQWNSPTCAPRDGLKSISSIFLWYNKKAQKDYYNYYFKPTIRNCYIITELLLYNLWLFCSSCIISLLLPYEGRSPKPSKGVFIMLLHSNSPIYTPCDGSTISWEFFMNNTRAKAPLIMAWGLTIITAGARWENFWLIL